MVEDLEVQHQSRQQHAPSMTIRIAIVPVTNVGAVVEQNRTADMSPALHEAMFHASLQAMAVSWSRSEKALE